MSIKTVYFVRHGEAQANVDRLLAGSRTDTPLTEKGQIQAHTTAKQLQDLSIDAIISSPLKRAYETARIIATDIGFLGNIVITPLFVERDYGSATGLPYEAASVLLDSLQADDVESVDDLAVRAQQAIDWLRTQPSTNVLVVSHGGFGQMFGTVVESKRPTDFLTYRHLNNTEFYEFKLEDMA